MRKGLRSTRGVEKARKKIGKREEFRCSVCARHVHPYAANRPCSNECYALAKMADRLAPLEVKVLQGLASPEEKEEYLRTREEYQTRLDKVKAPDWGEVRFGTQDASEGKGYKG